jgi:hypothetical protein
MNWGWGVQYQNNAYFAVGGFNPGADHFNYINMTIVNLHP